MRLVAALWLLLLLPTSAHAALRESFHLDSNGWAATDVLVVSEAPVLDGRVRVLEVWRGSAAVGDELRLDGLKPFAPEPARRIADDLAKRAHPERVTGARMVVFLVRDPRGWFEPATNGLQISTVWIEGGAAFGFQQTFAPGELLLVQVGTEADLRARIDALGRWRDALAAAREIADPARRAEALRPLLREEVARPAVYEALAACGPTAAPVFRELLDDPSLRDHGCGRLVAALRTACGPDAALDLGAFLEREALAWEAEAPTLDPEWWYRQAADEWAATSARRGRYLLALEVLRSLQAAPDPRCRSALDHSRAAWGLPAFARHGLEGPCEEALEALARR